MFSFRTTKLNSNEEEIAEPTTVKPELVYDDGLPIISGVLSEDCVNKCEASTGSPDLHNIAAQDDSVITTQTGE
jgi:hypothetical protein